jgi:thiol-disulfide isomerase/thioredoxin
MKTRLGMMLAASLLGTALAGTGQERKQSAARDPKIITVQGYQKMLSQYRGKPLLVTFWATWCEPCRDEYPMLNELAKQYAPQGLQVVGVNLDDDGDLILMRRFIARYKPVFPNYRKKPAGEDGFTRTVSPQWNGALPSSFFYTKDGKAAGHFVGEKSRGVYEDAIRKLLANGIVSN